MRGELLDKALIPSRDEVGIVYKEIRKNPVLLQHMDAAYYSICKNQAFDYALFKIAVDILLELGPLVVVKEMLMANNLSQKVDLQSSCIVRRLQN